MNKLIIDAAKDNIFFMIINNNNTYSVTHENSKNNYEKLNFTLNTKWSDEARDYGNGNSGSYDDVRLDDYIVCDLFIKEMLFQLSGLDNITSISNILLTEFS